MTTLADTTRWNVAWRPWSVRGPVLAGVLFLHGIALLYTGGKVEPKLLPSVPIELVDLPLAPMTTLPEQAPPEDMKVEPPPEQPTVAEDPPPPEPPPVEKDPEPEPEPPALKEELPPPPIPEPVKPPTPKPKPVERIRPDPPNRKQPVTPVVRPPVSNGPPAVAAGRSGPSSAEYGVLVSAALRRNLTYPASASGAGAVGVVLTIGPNGRTLSVSIASSSGSNAFDAAVRQAALAIQVPPPPDKKFIARTTIRFRLP